MQQLDAVTSGTRDGELDLVINVERSLMAVESPKYRGKHKVNYFIVEPLSG